MLISQSTRIDSQVYLSVDTEREAGMLISQSTKVNTIVNPDRFVGMLVCQ